MKTKARLFGGFTVLSITTFALTLALVARADVPAPPVEQSIGFPDVLARDQEEAFCRGCHAFGVDNRHHLLFGMTIPPDSSVPNPDANGDGVPDTVYDCLNCHDPYATGGFIIVRDCTVCHRTSPHHRNASMSSGECKSCHGSLVADTTDGHYIPTYPPSLVTPQGGGGDGLPANSRGAGAGACDYCHAGDGLEPPVIRRSMVLHHGTGIKDCSLCHLVVQNGVETRIRICEGCHSVASLHNIQADSPNANSVGIIGVGREDAGYGHVGRDHGVNSSDCWGCHGFAFPPAAGAAPQSGSGPMLATITGAPLQEADCRALGCHASDVPDRHHVLYGQPIPPGSPVKYPYPDPDGDGQPSPRYVCLGCHGPTITVVRDCTLCHSASDPHANGVCGNGIREAAEECDDGNTLDGDCCSASCTREILGSPCSDGQFCNGEETCDGLGTCQAGVPVDCGDGVTCTSDACDEVNDRCVNQPDNTKCPSDGLFCTGQEICGAQQGCVSTGTPCQSGTTCYEPADVCIPATGQVTICHIPGGKSAAAKTLSVRAGSVANHLAHGDKLGACPK